MRNKSGVAYVFLFPSSSSVSSQNITSRELANNVQSALCSGWLPWIGGGKTNIFICMRKGNCSHAYWTNKQCLPPDWVLLVQKFWRESTMLDNTTLQLLGQISLNFILLCLASCGVSIGKKNGQSIILQIGKGALPDLSQSVTVSSGFAFLLCSTKGTEKPATWRLNP